MAVEREALVLRVGVDDAWISPLAACSGCGGCQGRCDWLQDEVTAAGLRLPKALFDEAPVPGQRIRLRWEAPALLATAQRAYGWPLLGLLLGAGLAAMLNSSLRLGDAGVLLGALLGTLSGMALSKRALAAMRQLRVLPAFADARLTDPPASS